MLGIRNIKNRFTYTKTSGKSNCSALFNLFTKILNRRKRFTDYLLLKNTILQKTVLIIALLLVNCAMLVANSLQRLKGCIMNSFSGKFIVNCFYCFFFCSTIFYSFTFLRAQNAGKVLILGIDGCRQDALQQANATNIDQLLTHAVYSFDALTHQPTWSGTGWSSMLTGVWENKHNVYNNSFLSPNYAQYPHFIARVETINPALHTASVVHWGPINSIINTLCDEEYTYSTDLEVTNKAVDLLTNANPDVLFVDFDDVDHAGHLYGFHPSVSQYLNSIEVTDSYIGNILTALHNRPAYPDENWLILVSTDHGGTMSGHGGPSLEERNVFVIASNDQFTPRQIAKTPVTQPIPAALLFNGSNQYVAPQSPGNLFEFGSSQDFSIEIRVKYTALAGDAAFISDKNWNSGANAGFVFSTPASDQTKWKVNVADGTNRIDVTGSTINDGNWHHLTATFDRDGLLNIYQDGQLAGQAVMSSVGNINSGLPLTIAQDGTHAYPFWFNGAIAEVRVWNTVLNPETVAAWACAPVNNAHPNYANLMAYWQMTEGTGATLADASANAITAALQGSAPVWSTAAGAQTCYDYSQTPRIVDVACTALTHLGIGFLPEWQLDGHSIVLPLGGPDISCSGTVQTYTVPPQGNCSYNWTATGGTILTGQGTNTITVQWNTPATGEVLLQLE